MKFDTDILIVGAGPTGLALAAQLVRYGVSFVIVDKKVGVTQLSKALVVHARTLEIYDQIGLAQAAVADGQEFRRVTLLKHGKIKAELDFVKLGEKISQYPVPLIYEQSKNESLLYGFLRDKDQDVRWQTELESLTQNDEGVTATLRAADGKTQQLTARYLVGCDGASSTTRHDLGFEFEGSTAARLFYVADVTMEIEAPQDSAQLSFGREEFVAMFPMPGEKHWRLLGNLSRDDADSAREIFYDEIEEKVKALVQKPLDITEVRWFSTYKIHTRHAKRFLMGRCLLAGDAAHVHTPVGGQGMNTGIQDAYNLAWKLALVLRGAADEKLLETYNSERVANARRLLDTTDKAFDVIAAGHWYGEVFRDYLLPILASVVWQFEGAREFIFSTVTMLAIQYPESPLSRHEGDKLFAVKAGQYLPYFLSEEKSIYQLLYAPKFHLLAFSDDINALDKVNVKSSDWLDIHRVPLSARVTEIFGAEKPFFVLLRPDNHIAFLSDEIGEDDVNEYFGGLLRLGAGANQR